MADVSVQRTINASPAEVWELVSDPTRMGEWSPENTGASWLGDAQGPALGAKFRGSNKNGRFAWKTNCTVTRCVENEAFAFEVKSGPLRIAGWEFQLQADGDSTVVTQNFTQHEPELMAKIISKVIGVDDRHEFNRVGMEATLEAIAAELER